MANPLTANDVGPELAVQHEAYGVFCTLLGEFHYAYTALEYELNITIYATVTRLSKGRNGRVLVAVLGGQRMSPAKDTIKRLLRATKASDKKIAFVDALFHQLGEIQFFRDRLTHNFTSMSKDDPNIWVNMNFAGVRDVFQVEDISFHLSTLSAATIDVWWMREVIGPLFNHYVRRGSGATPELPTWRYTPAMLTRERPNKKRSRPPRKRQPQSSRTK